MTKPLRWDRVRFLAVAVLLTGMAYVTYDTQQKVRTANDERNALKAQVTDLRNEVKLLKDANVRKDAEIKRLSGELLKRGINPSPPAAPTVIVTVAPAPGQRPQASRPPAASSRPSPTRTTGPRPSPSPSPTCSTVYNPLTGRCATSDDEPRRQR